MPLGSWIEWRRGTRRMDFQEATAGAVRKEGEPLRKCPEPYQTLWGFRQPGGLGARPLALRRRLAAALLFRALLKSCALGSETVKLIEASFYPGMLLFRDLQELLDGTNFRSPSVTNRARRRARPARPA